MLRQTEEERLKRKMAHTCESCRELLRGGGEYKALREGRDTDYSKWRHRRAGERDGERRTAAITSALKWKLAVRLSKQPDFGY